MGGDSPRERERYLRNSSRKMTGTEKQSTANHSVRLRGVIWNTFCCDGERDTLAQFTAQSGTVAATPTTLTRQFIGHSLTRNTHYTQGPYTLGEAAGVAALLLVL